MAKTSEKPVAIKQPFANTEFENVRTQFRALVLGNANYFGNLKASPLKPVMPIVANTTYEEIGSVGFQPQLNRLNAVVYVNQSSGYSGDICSSGSPEYVRFYASYDDGKSWDDLGITSFSAYDIALKEAQANRLEYAVAIDFAPWRHLCFQRGIARVRAILSWNVPPPPNDPDWMPVWGEVHNTHIQIEPRRFFIFKDFVDLEVKLPDEMLKTVDLDQKIVSVKPKALSAVQLQTLYAEKQVEPHRFAMSELHALINQPATAPLLMAAQASSPLPELKIDVALWPDILSKLIAPVDGNTQYEMLEAIGLNPNQSTLEGVIRVKLPNGYSGGPCTAGSHEYVTFWADYDNNGTFETCLGSTSVNVYDDGELPAEGLEFGVFLPVNLTEQRWPCTQGARLVRIRAILSWQVVPPANNPDYVPVWGNRLETVIHIKPGPSTPLDTHTPNIETVGSMDVDDIHSSSGLANGPAQLAGFFARQSPFGGEVIITGHLAYPPDISSGASPLRYRVSVRKVGDLLWQPLSNSFDVSRRQLLNASWTSLPDVTQSVDADGFYEYREDFTTGINNAQITVVGNILARWNTGGLNGLYDIRIEAVDAANTHWLGNAVRIMLDNLAPTISAFEITTGGGNCADFNSGTLIDGLYNISDEHLDSLNLAVEPAKGGVFTLPAVLPRIYPTLPITLSEAGNWQLNTVGMPRCGYVVRLTVSDRTIVNSGSVGFSNTAVVGLCLRD